MEHIVFLTGRLAQRNLEKVLAGMQPPPFTWEVREIGLQVAGLMTADMVRRRVERPVRADRIIAGSAAATSTTCRRISACRWSAARRS